MAVVVGPSNYVEPYTGIPKPAPLHVDANGGLILGAGAVAALLGSVRIQDGAGASLATLRTPADASALIASLVVEADLMGFNGATEDRLRTAPLAAGGVGFLGTVVMGRQSGNVFNTVYMADVGDAAGPAAALLMTPALFGGTNVDRAREASGANLSATSGLGAALVSEPGEWNINNDAAVNAQATATRAAVAGTRHILKFLSFTLVSGAAPVAVQIQCVIRDGLTGVGAVIWTGHLAIQAVAGASDKIAVPGLHIVGTAGNAMTIEFTGAAGANTVESVTATGYDAS